MDARERRGMVLVSVMNAIAGLCLVLMGFTITDAKWGWLLAGIGIAMLILATASYLRLTRGT